MSGSAEALWDVRALGCQTQPTLQPRSAARLCSFCLLQHLASGFRQLCCKETTCSECASSKYDGHRLGDADEWLEDADAQDRRQLTEGIQEAKRSGPEDKKREREEFQQLRVLTVAAVSVCQSNVFGKVCFILFDFLGSQENMRFFPY